MVAYRNQKGFTLIELSIVVVVIALIVSGVIAGQSLVRQAELRDILSKSIIYKTAINTFLLKYNYLPGDMPGFSQYYPGVVSGNGDGVVKAPNGNHGSAESMWLQAMADGLFNGQLHTYSDRKDLLVLKPNNYVFRFGLACAGGGIPHKHSFLLLSVSSGAGFANYNGGSCYYFINQNFTAVTVKEAYNMDLKADDGKPSIGKIASRLPVNMAGPNCVSSGEYNLTGAADLKKCGLYISYE